jgi:MoxR-like ATPase
MQERRVTIGGETHPLPEPFFVLATQNPIEHEGTYPLPEAQIDRFMLKILVDYPGREAERRMLDRLLEIGPDAGREAGNPEAIAVAPVLGPEGLATLRRTAHAVYVDDRIRDYALAIVEATRPGSRVAHAVDGLVRHGASPRATLHLALAAKGSALLAGRGYVVPEDVKAIAPDVLRHRIALTYEAEADEVTADAVVTRVLDAVRVP